MRRDDTVTVSFGEDGHDLPKEVLELAEPASDVVAWQTFDPKLEGAAHEYIKYLVSRAMAVATLTFVFGCILGAIADSVIPVVVTLIAGTLTVLFYVYEVMVGDLSRITNEFWVLTANELISVQLTSRKGSSAQVKRVKVQEIDACAIRGMQYYMDYCERGEMPFMFAERHVHGTKRSSKRLLSLCGPDPVFDMAAKIMAQRAKAKLRASIGSSTTTSPLNLESGEMSQHG